MSSITLLFVGSVLLLNGLGLLGLVAPKATAPINAFVGLALITTVLFITLPVRGAGATDLDVLLGAVGYLLFAFTYLYVAINNFASLPGGGLGWYCGWAVLVSLFLAWVNFDRLDDPKLGAIWLAWAVLFTGFFLVIGLELDWLARPTGWLTIAEAFTTTTIPGALMLTGRWTDLSTGLVVATQAVVVVVFIGLAISARSQRDSRTVNDRVTIA